MLDKHYGPAHLHLYVDYATTFVYETGQVDELVRAESVKAFSSHYVRRFPPVLGGRPVQYVTFLRDPVEQFVSFICYARKYFKAAIEDPAMRSFLPPDMPSLSIRESARWMLDQPDTEFRNFRENQTTNFFARYPLLDSHGFDYADPRYREARLRVAQELLSRFLSVGITERMDASVAGFRRRAAEVGIAFPNLQTPVENRTDNQRESLEWIHPDDEVGQRLLASVKEDLELYRWALNTFHRP